MKTRDQFTNYSDVINSDWYTKIPTYPKPTQDKILKSTRLESMIYSDFASGNVELKEICSQGKSLLLTFDSIAQDVFTGFYSLAPKPHDDSELSAAARRFNKPIIEKVTTGEDYTAVKSICEGRELPAFDAAVEFADKIREKLPELMNELPDSKTTEILQGQIEDLRTKLQHLCSANELIPDEKVERKITELANRIVKKELQVADLEQKANEAIIKAGSVIKAAVGEALEAALEKAEETDLLLHAWGSDSGNPQDVKANEDILNQVRRNPKLLEMSRILGRYLKMFTDKKKNAFDYGLGDKHDITLGNNLSLCLSSELALLSTPETQPLFVRKYQLKRLKQYRRRERITKGQGDIIVCVDESYSMTDVILWAKAVAFTLLDIATKSKRKFALIRFSNDIETHLFLPEQFTPQDIFTAVDGFMNGGTNFEKPLGEVSRLIESSDFENADVVFVTDGECAISDGFAKRFMEQKSTNGFTVQGILLNKSAPFAGRSLEPFCDTIYRESELGFDEIAMKVIGDKAS